MPLISRTFDQLIDFTRTTAATYVNSAGLVTLTPPSVNLLLYTQEFDNPAWTKGGGTTVIPNQNPAAASLGPELGAAAAINIRPATGGTVTRSGGIITFTSPASGLSTAISQEITGLTIGRMYRFNGRMRRTVGASVATPQVRDASGGGGNGLAVGPAVTADWVSFSLYWVATVTTAYFSFASGAASQTIEVSEAEYSVREVIGGFIAAPDGTLTGDMMFANPGTHCPQIIQTGTTVSGSTYTASWFVRPGTHTFVQLAIDSQSADWCNFTLTGSGSVQNNGAAAGAISFDSATGFYRISMVYAANGSFRRPVLAIVSSGTATRLQAGTYTGTESVIIWGAQFEVVPTANITLGPVINNNGVSLNGGATDNGNGTYTMPSLGSARFVFPLASLVNGAIYQISIPIISTTGSYVSDWCDENSVSSTQVGTLVYYCGRTTYDNTFRFVDITSGSGFTTVIGTATIQQVTGTTGMPSTYAKNVGGLFPARFDYDPVTLAPRGILIEEQRVNLFTYSEQFDNAAWTKITVTATANTTTSPDGTVDADSLVASGGSAQHFINQSLSFTSGTTYTLSVFAKKNTLNGVQLTFGSGAFGTLPYANFDLNAGTSFASNCTATLTNFGNGWYRCTMTATANGTTTAGAVIGLARDTTEARLATFSSDGNGIYIYGAQLEAGAFATSYIPTVASTVTRTTDIAVVTAANFSSWYNQPQGTFVVEATQPAATGVNSRSLSANDGTVNESVQVSFLSTGTNGYGEVRDGGVAIVSITNGSFAVGSVAKMAFAVAANNAALSVNGASPTTDTSLTMPAVDRLNIGTHAGAASPLNGHVRSIRYYPARLNNAQLQTLTA
jgi:hypothetical protein